MTKQHGTVRRFAVAVLALVALVLASTTAGSSSIGGAGVTRYNVVLAGTETEDGFALAGTSDAVNDLESLAPLGDHLGDHLGRVLEVGVDQDDGVAPGVLYSCRDGGLMAKVSREGQDPDPGVQSLDIAKQTQSPVTAAIVDVDQFVRRLDSRQHLA